MAERLGEAILELKTSDRGFSAGVDKAEGKAKRLGRTFNAVGRQAQRLGRNLSLFVTAPIVAVGVASVKTASDVQEMQNLFAVTFGEAANDVEEWARRTAAANQRSRFEFMRTAADFAAFLKPLGVAPDAVAPMSKALTQLTTDLSSFRNLSEEVVFTRLFSGLAGETEAVRRLGIDIGKAALDAELLALGINKTSMQASQSEKVMARFSLIMKQTGDAQGDAARTAGSFENQARGLGATIKDLRVEIGQRFLPVAQRIVVRLREVGQNFLRLPKDVQSGIVAIGAFIAIIGPAIFALGLLARGIGFAMAGFAFIPKVLRGVFLAIKGALIGIQVVTIGFLAFFSTVPGLIITSLAAIVGGFFIFKGTLIGFFKGLVLAIKDAFVAGFNNKVVRPFQEAMNSLIDFLPDSVVEFLDIKALEVNDVVESDFKDNMQRVVGEAMRTGKQEFESFKRSASGAIDVVAGKFGEIKGAVSDFIPELNRADFTMGNMGAKFDGLLRDFAGMQGSMSDTGQAAQDAAEQGIEAFDEFGTSVKSTLENNMTDALTRVRGIGDAMKAILRDIASALIRTRLVQPLVGAIPGFAHGGRPPAGKPYMVGEKGPELRIDDKPGTIIPNHAIGAGMGGMSQTFNFPFVIPPMLESFIRNVATASGRDAAISMQRARQGRF